MFDDTTLGSQVLKNPAMVQGMVLTEFQERLGGTYSVADPNNAFNIQLEAASSMNAQTVRYMESKFRAQYAVRATTAAELYNNMSDFDYLNMVANPSSTSVSLTFDLDYLIANAQSYDSTYNRVVIPAISQFYIGPLTFGVYYPINININKITNNINVLWDTTTANPLQTLSTNMVQFTTFSYGGLNLISLQIPVSQFAMNTTTYPVVAQQGFIKNIPYVDQFYAVRVFTNLPSGSWTELAYTLSETVYDPTTPTAKINIQNDINQLTVSIPQIYFTNSQIGNQVQVVILTTKGALTLDLTSVEVASCNVYFGIGQPGVTAYSSILQNLASISLTPVETVITGGSNSMTFTQLRNLIVNGGLYTSAPVTPAQLDAFSDKAGFTITKYLDNVTDRIYYASNTITGGQNGYIMTTMGNINVTSTAAQSTSSILSFASDNAITILPTTIYSYNSQTNVCTPLTDAQLAYLNGLTGQDFVNEVNSNLYTQCPFHIVTYTNSQYPLTKSFNLMNPSVSSIVFDGDNTLLTPQMSVTTATVIHNSNGTGGYTIRLGVVKTAAMQAIAESNITVVMMTTDSNGDVLYGTATLMGTTGSGSSMLYVYEMNVPTNYYITETGTFQTTLAQANSNSTVVQLPLTSNFDVVFLLNQSLYPSVGQNTTVVANVPAVFTNTLGVSRQTLTVVFGTDLSSQVFNITNASWSATTYATYPQTVYQTYTHDVYQKDSTGKLVYTINNGVLDLNLLHHAGDYVLDANGNQIVKYAAGTIKIDGFGNPIVMNTRSLQYYVTSIMFDLRLFYSQNPADVTFVSNLTANLASYFATISGLQSSLLEQTQLFYVPNSTMGTATFSAGNNTPITLNLGFSFGITLYVPQSTLADEELQNSLTSDVQEVIQAEMANSIISMTDIGQNIKTNLGSAISSVDVAGIDGTTGLQTVIVPAGTTNPIIAQQLVWNSTTNQMTLEPSITVKYALAA
jgi:hypothetical protein